MGRRFVVRAVLVLSAAGLLAVGPVGGAGAQTLPPTIAVAPFSDLVHRQEVRVGGFGFAPHAQLAFAQCVADVNEISDCDLSTSKFVDANQHGAFRARTIVKRLIRIDDETIDCAAATGTCVIGGGVPDGSAGNKFPLHFDPDVPVPTPTIAVSPDTDLEHEQLVTVVGAGFAPQAGIAVLQCPTGVNGFEFCFFHGSSAFADEAGGFEAAFAVPRAFRTFTRSGPRVHDCVVNSCELVVIGDDAIEPLRHPLGFDAGATPLPLPITVAPDEDLAHRQVVTVSGTGFSVGRGITVSQCVAGADPFEYPSSCGASVYTVDDEGDRFTSPFTVRRWLIDRNGTEVDCAASAATCELVAASEEDPYEIGRAPLEFDPNAPLPPPPTMKARPRKDLRGGQAITVSGEGFSPFATVGIAQCKNNGTGQDDCDLSTTTYVGTDEAGAFETTFIVRGRLNTGNGPVNCKAAPKTCAVGGANINDIQGEQAGAGRLTFRRITG